MALVICDSVQYNDDALPAHVDPKQCVPHDEWFRKNRTADTAPSKPAAKAEPKVADPPEDRPDTGSTGPKARRSRSR